ncbi:MAG: hypothetical protein Q9211_006184 [Gyalolechia sp. 1 TL-2023]
MPIPKDSFAFTDAMADILRLPDETLAMSYIYLNKYLRFHRTSQTPDPLDSYAELILLRVLGFELRLPSPMEYLQRYIERAMEDVEEAGENYDSWDREGKEEYRVVDGVMETRLGRMCSQRALEACKDYQLANLYPARTVALGVVHVVLEDRGLRIDVEVKAWVEDVASGKVDIEDLKEVTEILKKTHGVKQ